MEMQNESHGTLSGQATKKLEGFVEYYKHLYTKMNPSKEDLNGFSKLLSPSTV